MPVFNFHEARHIETLVTEAGQSATITVTTDTTPDAISGPTITTVNHVTKAIVSQFNTEEIDGTVIQSADFKVHLSPRLLTITPSAADRLRIGTVSYEIINVRKVSPAGTNILFTLQVRA